MRIKEQELKRINELADLPETSYWYTTTMSIHTNCNLTIDICRACLNLKPAQYIDSIILQTRFLTYQWNVHISSLY